MAITAPQLPSYHITVQEIFQSYSKPIWSFLLLNIQMTENFKFERNYNGFSKYKC